MVGYTEEALIYFLGAACRLVHSLETVKDTEIAKLVQVKMFESDNLHLRCSFL